MVWYPKSGMVFCISDSPASGVSLIHRRRRLMWQSPPQKCQKFKIRSKKPPHEMPKISWACCARWKPTSPISYFMPAIGWPIKFCLDNLGFRDFRCCASQVVFLPPKSGKYHFLIPRPLGALIPQDPHTGKSNTLLSIVLR